MPQLQRASLNDIFLCSHKQNRLWWSINDSRWSFGKVSRACCTRRGRTWKSRSKTRWVNALKFPRILLSAQWERPFANEFLLKLPDACTLASNGLHSFLHNKYLPDSMEYVMCIQCFPFERKEESLHDEHWFMLDAFVESFSISLVKYSRRFTLFAQRNHILFLFA